MADTPDIQRGEGPDALAYGEATQANAAIAAADAAPPQPDLTTQPQGPPAVEAGAPNPPQDTAATPATAGAPSPEAPFKPTSDEEKYLFAGTARPNEPVTAGLEQMNRPPANWADWAEPLSLLANTSPSAKAAFDALMFDVRRSGQA